MIKICTKCGTEYSATAEYFYRQTGGKFGLQAACKVCCCKDARERGFVYYSQHRKEQCDFQKKYRNTLKGHLQHVYCGLNYRCNNLKCKDYQWYGERGIKNKFKSFDDFFSYVVNNLGIKKIEQIKGLQIDRIDNDGHYEPGNIRWVTSKINNNNRRNSKNDRNG